MHTRRWTLLASVACLASGPPVTSLTAQDAISRGRAAIRYLERGVRSDGSARTVASGPAQIGIDVNSSVEILVNEDLLRSLTTSLLPDAQRADLSLISERMDQLGLLIDSISAVTAAFEQLVGAEVDDLRDFVEQRGDAARAANRIFNPLEAAIRSRLRSEGVPDARLGNAVDDVLQRTATGPRQLWGFQWDTVAVIMREEIETLRADLNGRLDEASVTARLQANLLRPDGPNPIFLPGYNEVETGPAVRYPKIAFAISEEEERAFAAYDSLASRIRETNDARGEITALLRREAREQFPEIKGLMTTASKLDDAVGSLASQLSTLGGRIGATRQRVDAEPRAQASEFASKLEAFGQQLLRDLEPARAFMRLRAPTAGMTSVDAMDEVLGAIEFLAQDALLTFMSETWTDRADELEGILAGASAAADEVVRSTGGLLDGLTNSLGEAENILQDVSGHTLLLLERLRSDDAINVPLPPPPGLTSRSFSAGLGTRFDLQTIAGGREPGQRIVVTYELLRGEEVLLDWTDDLLIQSYGLSGATAASLAFVKRRGVALYKPEPIVTWTLRYRGWPGDNERGVGAGLVSHLGIGISAATLDFVDEESVEIGLAATLSLSDLVFVGGGFNLQASDDRTFWFFSFRLLECRHAAGGIRTMPVLAQMPHPRPRRILGKTDGVPLYKGDYIQS